MVSLRPVFLLLILGMIWPELQAQEEKYYSLETLPIPENIVLEVGGMDFMPDGRLVVCTRRGEVWMIQDPYATEARPENFKRFARGLHEPLGLKYRDGAVYTVQRGELTRLVDEDGDDKADLYESICQWPLSGNYHDYSYGPFFLPNGNMLVALNLSWIGYGESLSKWRGWMLEITPDGEMMPYATGMRSPAGTGLNEAGHIFYSDNQGDWVGSGRVTHVEKGDFVGNPSGLSWTKEPGSPLSLDRASIDDSFGTLYEAAKQIPEVKPPAVWFPHGVMGISTSDILEDRKPESLGLLPDNFWWEIRAKAKSCGCS